MQRQQAAWASSASKLAHSTSFAAPRPRVSITLYAGETPTPPFVSKVRGFLTHQPNSSDPRLPEPSSQEAGPEPEALYHQ
jgi:hypothetical protein